MNFTKLLTSCKEKR